MLTIASIVKNEADRYLSLALECWQALADRIVVVDNGSTDGTVELLEAAGVELHHWPTPMDGAEWIARKRLWDLAVEGSEWVVHCDADQCFAGDFRPHLEGRLVGFRVYDLWSPTEYRSDAWWRGHSRAWWLAVNVKGVAGPWKWRQRAWHSGHTPDLEFFGKPRPIPNDCSILHYAYATEAGRQRHAFRYAARSGVLTNAERFHAGTILDPHPRLEPLPFEPRWKLL